MYNLISQTTGNLFIEVLAETEVAMVLKENQEQFYMKFQN